MSADYQYLFITTMKLIIAIVQKHCSNNYKLPEHNIKIPENLDIKFNLAFVKSTTFNIKINYQSLQKVDYFILKYLSSLKHK